MTRRVDFLKSGLFSRSGRRHRAGCGPWAGRRDQVSDHRQGLDHDDAGHGGPRAEGQRDVHAAQGWRRFAGLRWWMPGVGRARRQHADHGRAGPHAPAQIVDEAFRRRAILEMEPRIRALADELAGELFAEGSPADLVERYARGLPLAVICELLGLPHADRPKFIAWAEPVARVTGVSLHAHALAALPHEALSGGAPGASARSRRRGSDCGACAGREGRRPDQRRRDGRDGIPAAGRRDRRRRPI